MHAEVIVIRCGDEAVPAALQAAHPEVQFCSAPIGTSEAQLRTIAMLEASGDIVALRRAADVVDALWLDAHYRAATGDEPDDFDWMERSIFDSTNESVIVDGVSADTAARRAAVPTRHAVESTPASGAPSAA
jgi:hypothetical protein